MLSVCAVNWNTCVGWFVDFCQLEHLLVGVNASHPVCHNPRRLSPEDLCHYPASTAVPAFEPVGSTGATERRQTTVDRSFLPGPKYREIHCPHTQSCLCCHPGNRPGTAGHPTQTRHRRRRDGVFRGAKKQTGAAPARTEYQDQSTTVLYHYGYL